ncbi:MAG: DUF2723 domain-containing protein [Bacteroidaceae bacterium]|nr:DUF2723 domain-containing protein [Bacteroidaceae bacterium]
MKTYKIVNNLVGWIVFVVAAFTYCSTIEPTASFWDCPEFISTATKLEVGHPPGAPFFMLVGNLFSHFASDSTQVAKMINTMSALLSAGCILFLFWSVTHLAKKLICEDNEEVSTGKLIAIMASGIAGSLIYTWSDTFWFSAVEGEVYAFSSFFTALVFWLILKWEDNAHDPSSDRWIVFIAYLVGLSIGVHLLNLLCIPAIVLVYYYKMSKNPTGKGSLAVLALSGVLVAAVLYGVVPGIVKIGGWFELLFVNTLGMPYNTGLYIYLVILAACLIWSLYVTAQAKDKKKMYIAFLASTALLGIPFYGHGFTCVFIGIIVLAGLAYLLYKKAASARFLNTSILCMTLMTIGYSSYAIIVIRSTANPPMDQNSPEDVFTLGEYLGREQYGERPLFWGQTYASEPNVVIGNNGDLVFEQKKGAPVYQRKEKSSADEKDEYVKIREKISIVYPFNQCMLFPRIYDEDHKANYIQWLGGVTGKTVDYNIPTMGTRQVQIPTQIDNMRFFFSYQLNFMYWRYFMWNFAGRQNDKQGLGELEHGNWLTGFSFIDNMMLGDQDLLPTELKENKGHNVFYCLPLILGLIGFFWQAFGRGQKGIQQFWVVFFLFFMTGIAIVIYLNQTPSQPRERDYAYAGSFYAFAMWCGLGITAIYTWLEQFLGEKTNKRMAAIAAGVISFIPALAVPLQMVSQTWDDHDRSGRYVCRDFGLNYLETIPHDGVIFTNGDNDTFPLWYNQDTEGNRTDVRVCNLSYLQTDWYIDQMKRPAFEGDGQSSSLPISWNRLQYVSGSHEMIDVNPTVNIDGGSIRLKELVKQIYKEEPEAARKIWGEDPFELTNAIKKFVLKEGIDPDYKDFVASIPSCLPSDTLYVKVDKDAVRRSGMKIFNDSIPDYMDISLKGQSRITKSFMMLLEMIGQSNFSRPLYMSTTVGASNYANLYRHFILEGIAWRITPYTFENNKPFMETIVDVDKQYENMMHKFHYGNLSQPGLYIDETTERMCYTHRRWFAALATNLVTEGKIDSALKVVEKCEKEIPSYNIPHNVNSGSLDLAGAYIAAKKFDKANIIMEQLIKRSCEYINWYISLPENRFKAEVKDCGQELSILYTIQKTYSLVGEQGSEFKSYAKTASELDKTLDSLYNAFIVKCTYAGIDPR